MVLSSHRRLLWIGLIALDWFLLNGIKIAFNKAMFGKYTSVMFITLSLLIAYSGFAQESKENKDAYLSIMAYHLHEKINQARENPLETASSLGMEPEKILSEQPELYDILSRGLSPLHLNDNLYKAAHAHAEDMLAKNYFSHNSPDNRSYEDRIIEKGYMPAASGESIGILKFVNFIEPDVAANLIFENMFRDQLNPSGTDRNILNPNVKDIGISLETGILTIDGTEHNVYIVICDFGSPVEKVELEFFQLINLARFNPMEMAFLLGVDLNYIMTYLPDLYADLPARLPSLTFNPRLYGTAKSYTLNIFENGYSHNNTEDELTFDELTFIDRIRESGYDPFIAEEAVEYSFCVDRGYFQLFENLMIDEFFQITDEYAELRLFNPALKEAGIGFITGESEKLAGLCSKSVNLMVADFGTPVVPKKPGIVGIAYTDQNYNGFYTQGEGIPNILISVESPSGFYRDIYTNEAGGFTVLSLEPDEYRLKAHFDNYEIIEDVKIEKENEFVIFKGHPDMEKVIEDEEIVSVSF